MNEIYYPEQPTEAQEYATKVANLSLDANLEDLYSVIEHGADDHKHSAVESLRDLHANMIALAMHTVQENGLDITSETEDANRAAMLLTELVNKAEFIAKRTGRLDETVVLRPEIEQDIQAKLSSVLLAVTRMSGRIDFTYEEVVPLAAMLDYQTQTARELITISLMQKELEGKEATVSPAMQKSLGKIESHMITPLA